jgi:hypothetical protein
VSVGSLNQDRIGIALSANNKCYKFGFDKEELQFTRIGTICSRRIVEYENGAEICTNGWKILGVASHLWSAMLTVIASLQNASRIVQLVSYSCSVNLHAGSKNYQLVPLRYLRKIEKRVKIFLSTFLVKKTFVG